MQNPSSHPHPIWHAVGWFVLASLIFSLAYTQAPLYYSNQHQYFLHGLAQGGKGMLAEDWLANTKDPTPVFTALVVGTYRYLHPWLFYLYYALLMGAYLCASGGVAVGHERGKATLLQKATLATVILLIHSALIRYFSVYWFGKDYPWFLQAGLAGQYVLGDMFQPSTFGVLLIVAIYFFGKDKPLVAATLSAAAGVVHPTYLLGGALTIAFLLSLAWDRRWQMAMLVGMWSLLLVSPILYYSGSAFLAATGENFAEAQNILVHMRIPHHAIPRLWADEISFLQRAWMIVGIILAWRTRLFLPMLVPFLLSSELTFVQIVTDNDALALLFPWRITVFLMPVATAVIFGRVILWIGAALPEKATVPNWLGYGINAIVVGLLVGAGVWIMVNGLGYQSGDEELAMMRYVRDHAEPGQVYLIPAPVPALEKNVRGARASTFVPLSQKRGNRKLIPINLQQFRLFTGVPIYVDFKAIPYFTGEVLEWRERLQTNTKLFDAIKQGKAACDELMPELKDRGITHVVTTAQHPIDCAGMQQVYGDEFYLVYRVEEK